MKRMFLLVVVAVAVVALLIAGCAPPPPGGRTTITLKFATFWVSTDFQPAIGHSNWTKAISDRVLATTPDEGGYKIEWDMSYIPSPTPLWSGVVGGTYDVITSGPGYTPGILPLWEGPEYPAPLTRKNALTNSMAYQGLYATNGTAWRTQMDSVGVKVMHLWSTGPGYFLMIQDHNVTTLQDFWMQGESEQKERIRAANPASALTIAALNASVYSCAMSQALEKFEAKLVDGILCPTDTPKGFGLGAYVRCGTVAPFSYQFVFMKVMNQAKWNSLPASVQAVFNEVNAKWPEYYGKLRTWGEYDGLQYCYATIPGFYMYDLPTLDPTEYQLWVDKCYPGLKDTWIAVSPATRGALWGNYTANQTYYDTTPPWSTWTHSWPTPPAPPTFP